MNNNAIIKVSIFAGLLVLAMYLGDIFLSIVLQKPIEEIPAVAQFVTHGITLALIFVFIKKYLRK